MDFSSVHPLNTLVQGAHLTCFHLLMIRFPHLVSHQAIFVILYEILLQYVIPAVLVAV